MAYESYGPGVFGPYYNPGAPVAGTNAVQTLTFAGPVAGGTIKLALDGISTANINASATAATFVSAIQAALDAVFGGGQIVAAAGTYTAGAGTITLTFSGSNYARKTVSLMTVVNNLTGTSPTVSNATTTTGVNATYRDAAVGSTMVDTTGAKHYVKTAAQTWTVTGSQT